MAGFTCPKSVRAYVLRVTRLNECGVPLDPMVPNSRVQFSGFSKLELAPDIENGADITLKNAAGMICVRDRDCKRLKGLDATLDLCGFLTPVMEMLLDTQMLTDPDNPGSFRGFVLRDDLVGACATPKMIDLWTKNANRAQCGVGGTGSAAYMQHNLPFTNDWQITGNLTFDNANAAVVSLKGYVQSNPNWFPSFPGSDFPSYTPSGGSPSAVPTGAAPALLPTGIAADPWTLADQTAFRGGAGTGGGPYGAITVPGYPAATDCDYVRVSGS